MSWGEPNLIFIAYAITTEAAPPSVVFGRWARPGLDFLFIRLRYLESGGMGELEGMTGSETAVFRKFVQKAPCSSLGDRQAAGGPLGFAQDRPSTTRELALCAQAISPAETRSLRRGWRA